MREEKLISDFDTTAYLSSLTGSDKKGRKKVHLSKLPHTESHITQILETKRVVLEECLQKAEQTEHSKTTGFWKEESVNNKLAKKINLSQPEIEHFLYLIMCHSVSKVKNFMNRSGVFKAYKESELCRLMYRALAVTSIRFYSRKKNLDVFKIALFNRAMCDFYQ
jgi:glutamate synthase domain-containing protein 1